MASPAKKKTAGKSKLDIGGALTRKFGPLPAWVYLLVGAGLIYWWRHRSSTTGASSTSTTAPDTSAFGGSFTPTGDSGGGGGSSDGGPPPSTTVAGGGDTGGDTGDTTGGGGSHGASTNFSSSGGLSGAQLAAATKKAQTPVPATSKDFGQAAQARTAAGAAAGVPVPFGGVSSVVTNAKTGVQTTTYVSGRVVEQAKGKSAYVAKSGSGAPAAASGGTAANKAKAS